MTYIYKLKQAPLGYTYYYTLKYYPIYRRYDLQHIKQKKPLIRNRIIYGK